MAAPVRIEAGAFSDQRYELLGQLAGYSRFEALGRMAHLWSVCTELGCAVVSESRIKACLGLAGADAIVEAELGERTEGGVGRPDRMVPAGGRAQESCAGCRPG